MATPLDQRKIDDELERSRQEHEKSIREGRTVEQKVKHANAEMARAEEALQKSKAEAEKVTTEYAKIQKDIADYPTKVKALKIKLEAEVKKLERAA